jgi:4-aminobutyrate aminotransferase-like enzyme
MHATGGDHFLAFAGGYHGRTLGALAVSGERGRNERLGPFRPEALILPWPEDAEGVAETVQRIEIEAGRCRLAGVLVEPWQATAGIRPTAPGLLVALRRLCDRLGLPLLLDEVFTGFGRTGTVFAFADAGIVPDLLILAKSLGGGLPLGLVAGNPAILRGWAPGTQSSTFQLHPLAAAASLAFLEVLEAEDLPARARAVAAGIDARRAELLAIPCVREVRGAGAMHGIEIVDPITGGPDRERTGRVRKAALELGLVTWECGTHGHVIGLVPPLTIPADRLDQGLDRLVAALRAAG